MLALRAIGRLLRSVLHVLHGMWVMRGFPRMGAAQRHAAIQWWSQGVVRHIGMTLQVRGMPNTGATLLVANHVSWLDIAAVHAAVPHARFVSKADVLRWPLLGWLIRGAGTLFIERDRKRDALRVVHAMAASLQRGDTVAVFPEGTTGAGPVLLPFHANLLQAAISAGVPVQPVVLRYAEVHAGKKRRFSPAVEFIGATSLLQSVWRVASAPGLTVHVDLLPAVPTAGADRRGLADQLHALVNARLVCAE